MRETDRVRAWSFPKHRPQMYALRATDLWRLPRYYSFGREMTGLIRLLLTFVLATPVLRRLVAGRHDLELPFSRTTLHDILEAISETVSQDGWAAFKSSWQTRRLILFSFDDQGQCSGVTHVSPVGEATLHPRSTGNVVRVPQHMASKTVSGWELHTVEPVPAWHRPHPWDLERLAIVLEDVERIVAAEIERPAGSSDDLAPIHGDFTPWNLRVDPHGQTWLFDWEWAGWGPPHTDLLRFALATSSLTTNDPAEILSWIHENVPVERRDLVQAAAYWLDQPIYRELSQFDLSATDSVTKERRQGVVEASVLSALTGEG